MRNLYLDSSAVLKFIFSEEESTAARKEIRGVLYSSELVRVEVMRAVLRIEPELEARALDVLSRIRIIKIKSGIMVQAERLPSHVKIRGMDAIHLASANTLGRLGHTIVTYDKNMAKAAKALGFSVESPGAKI
ncbi:COG1848 Predicted nucleic acid-binding protein, contains PIN domain [Candidatus Nanopelagicaceae bacterium]